MQFIRCLLASLCLWVWSWSFTKAEADASTSPCPHDTTIEQASTDSSHFYLDMTFATIRFYHQDSLFSIGGQLEANGDWDHSIPPRVQIGLQGRPDQEMFTFWITPISVQPSGEGQGYRTLTFYLPNDFQYVCYFTTSAIDTRFNPLHSLSLPAVSVELKSSSIGQPMRRY